MRSILYVAALAAVVSVVACKTTSKAEPTVAGSDPKGDVTPEQATQALLDGDDPSRFMDPTIGLVQIDGPMVCGAKADAAIRSTLVAMKEDLAGGATLSCATDALNAAGDAAACTTSPDMEGDLGHGVRFVFDATRGLRLAGLEVYEAGTSGTDAYEQSFDAYVAEVAAAPRCE